MIGILEGGGMQWIKQGKLQWAAWSLFFNLTALYPITCVLAPVLYNSAVRPIAAALGMQKKNEGITLLRPWAKNSCKVVKGNVLGKLYDTICMIQLRFLALSN